MTHTQTALQMLNARETGSLDIGNDTRLVVVENAIVFRFFTNGHISIDVLAARVGETIIGNSSALRNLLNHRKTRDVATPEQLEISELIPMIPFTALKEADLKIESYVELDKGKAEILSRHITVEGRTLSQVKDFEKRGLKNFSYKKTGVDYDKKSEYAVSYYVDQHFAGARLFKCEGKIDGPNSDDDVAIEKTFLIDIDRVEIQHGIVNPFLVELPFEVKTIAEAYESLKPIEVKNAKVFERQGEWFFIPCDEMTLQRINKIEEERIYAAKRAMQPVDLALRGVLQAGRNRPNRVENMVGIDDLFYVKGIVSHDGREHADLELKTYHQAIPNTATLSWTITGDVD